MLFEDRGGRGRGPWRAGREQVRVLRALQVDAEHERRARDAYDHDVQPGEDPGPEMDLEERPPEEDRLRLVKERAHWRDRRFEALFPVHVAGLLRRVQSQRALEHVAAGGAYLEGVAVDGHHAAFDGVERLGVVLSTGDDPAPLQRGECRRRGLRAHGRGCQREQDGEMELLQTTQSTLQPWPIPLPMRS